MDKNLMLLHEEIMHFLKLAQQFPDVANLFKNQAVGACLMYARLFPDMSDTICKCWDGCLHDAFRRIEESC
jgi:hypothetical protein